MLSTLFNVKLSKLLTFYLHHMAPLMSSFSTAVRFEPKTFRSCDELASHCPLLGHSVTRLGDNFTFWATLWAVIRRLWKTLALYCWPKLGNVPRWEKNLNTFGQFWSAFCRYWATFNRLTWSHCSCNLSCFSVQLNYLRDPHLDGITSGDKKDVCCGGCKKTKSSLKNKGIAWFPNNFLA